MDANLLMFPGDGGGRNPHWAVVCGFFTDRQGNLKYLVSQLGYLYLWSGSDLLKVNIQMKKMKENPIKKESTVFIIRNGRHVRKSLLDLDLEKGISISENTDGSLNLYGFFAGEEREYSGPFFRAATKRDEDYSDFACAILSA
jgi:hypothetical protein